jgi:hypothetical protein
MTSVKSDTQGQTIRVDAVTHLIRVDGIIVCKMIVRDKTVFLEFKDGDRMRSQCRKTQFVEIPLEVFNKVLLAEYLDDVSKWPD